MLLPRVNVIVSFDTVAPFTYSLEPIETLFPSAVVTDAAYDALSPIAAASSLSVFSAAGAPATNELIFVSIRESIVLAADEPSDRAPSTLSVPLTSRVSPESMLTSLENRTSFLKRVLLLTVFPKLVSSASSASPSVVVSFVARIEMLRSMSAIRRRLDFEPDMMISSSLITVASSRLPCLLYLYFLLLLNVNLLITPLILTFLEDILLSLC